MQKRAFLNRIRSLYNIEGFELPELTSAQQSEFLRDPVQYFLCAGESESDAIMREVERHQYGAAEGDARVSRSKRAKSKYEGQREMLLPISGGKVQREPAAPEMTKSTRRVERR